MGEKHREMTWSRESFNRHPLPVPDAVVDRIRQQRRQRIKERILRYESQNKED